MQFDPSSKLATARGLEESVSSLGEVLELGTVDADELYAAMDWLLSQQQKIERALAKRHLQDGTLALCDVTSTYFEGRPCPLARLGLSHVERSFRCFKGVDLKVRPVHLRLTDRVRAHIFLCMLAYYIKACQARISKGVV